MIKNTLPEQTVAIVADPLPPIDQNHFLLLFGVAPQNAGTAPRIWADSAAFAAEFGECNASQFAAVHLGIDPQQRAFAFMPLAIATPGVLHLSGDTGGGTSVVTAASSPEPLGRYEARIEVITGGTIGTDGIVLRVSRDNGRTSQDVRLGTAVFYEFAGYGMRFDFAAGTLTTGRIITGWTEPPTWDSSGLNAAFTLLSDWGGQPQIWYFADELSYSQMQAVQAKLTTWNASPDRLHTRAILNRRYYHHTVSASVSGTFAASTITRAAGSFIDDGFKVGQSITVAGSSVPGNNGTFVKISNVSALVLTLTPSPAFTVAGPEPITVAAFETLSGYLDNMATEYPQLDRMHVQLTQGVRYTRPDNGDVIDGLLGHVFAAMEIRYPEQIQPGLVEVIGDAIGGTFGNQLGAIIRTTPLERIHVDAIVPSMALLATAPYGDTALLLTLPGGQLSPVLNWVPNSSATGDTSNPSWVGSRIECFVRAFLRQTFSANWMANIALDDTDPTKFDRGALSDLERATRTALALALAPDTGPKVSNVDTSNLLTLDPTLSTPANGLRWRGVFVLFFANRKNVLKLQIVTPGA